jgi:hypothetical protein
VELGLLGTVPSLHWLHMTPEVDSPWALMVSPNTAVQTHEPTGQDSLVSTLIAANKPHFALLVGWRMGWGGRVTE